MFSKTAKEFGHLGGHMALTLGPSDLGEHANGWKIEGHVYEDYYEWVNEFEATHPDFGRVWGNFEDVVYADSEQAFEDFYKNHPPMEWDYWDI
jgi:hypothetical protein